MLLTQFLTVALVHILAAMSPGPDFAIVTRNSLVYSRKVGVYTALGIALGLLVHIAYSLLGIGFLIAQSIVVFNIIKYIGAGYLLYIGYKALLSKPVAEAEEKVTSQKVTDISAWSAIKIGFLTNALNPKATMFFLAVFTQVIDPATPMWVQLVYGLEMIVATFAWFSIVAYLFSNYVLKQKLLKVRHRIDHVMGAVLIALGIKVALSSQK
jgi:RhtB (resistance to homoserine/threonine) family protein